MNTVERARRYLAKVPPAVSGAGGHAQTFKAACMLVRFGLERDTVRTLLMEWNTGCQPPWSPKEIEHKVADAFRREVPDPELAGNLEPIRSTLTTVSIRAAEAVRKGQAWPRLEEPIEDGRRDEVLSFNLVPRLATLRGLSVEGCRLAALRGLLRFCEFRRQLCWAVTDRRRINAQVRQMTGMPWQEIGGKKAWTLKGSRGGWPLGVDESRPSRVVLLVEGGPDLLAGHHFIVTRGRQSDAAVVAVLGASNYLPDDALPAFRGKRVRIFAHTDATGVKGAETWWAQLRSVGAEVDVADLSPLRMADGRPVGDLNDAARIHPEDAEELEDLIP